MNGLSQFYIFLVSVACGLAGGVLYDGFHLLCVFFRARWVRIVCDALFVVAFGGLYLLVAVSVGFPAPRFYIALGCVSGLLLYLISFHKIVAFFAKKVYNRIRRMREARAERVKHSRGGKRTRARKGKDVSEKTKERIAKRGRADQLR